MTKARSISQALAPLVVQGNVPLEIIAVVGEIISIDARLLDYTEGASKRVTFKVWEEFLEAYEVLLERTESTAATLVQARDWHALSELVLGLKDKLVALR